jgi:hypothetical protein
MPDLNELCSDGDADHACSEDCNFHMLNGARRVEMTTKRGGKLTDYCPVVSTTRNRALPLIMRS